MVTQVAANERLENAIGVPITGIQEWERESHR